MTTTNTNTLNSTIHNKQVWHDIRAFIIGVATVTILAVLLLLGGYSDTHYSTIAEVYSVDDTETIFVDGAGYLWAASNNGYTKGQFVELYFENNGTDYKRTDDKIVKIKVLDN